jgi:hypothetical protein
MTRLAIPNHLLRNRRTVIPNPRLWRGEESALFSYPPQAIPYYPIDNRKSAI